MGTDHTIGRRLRLVLIAVTTALALPPAAGAAALGRGPNLKHVFVRTFPQSYQGTSVALDPDGIPWFGLEADEGPATLAKLKMRRLSLKVLGGGKEQDEGRSVTSTLRFDPEGDLWFGVDGDSGVAIARRSPDGTVSGTMLAGDEPVNSLAIAADGRIWFTRGFPGGEATVGWMTSTAGIGEVALAPESWPRSITIGPDGAAWFTEARTGQIGRVATDGEVQLFPVGPGVEPRQIVAGSDGALWFSESGEPSHYWRTRDRIARITTSGEVTQFPLRFGGATTALAVDPRGFIWFGTEEGEISSIAPSGAVGGRGCLNYCEAPIAGIAPTADGSLWFAAGSPLCNSCGGGTAQMISLEGTALGKVPAGALRVPR